MWKVGLAVVEIACLAACSLEVKQDGRHDVAVSRDGGTSEGGVSTNNEQDSGSQRDAGYHTGVTSGDGGVTLPIGHVCQTATIVESLELTFWYMAAGIVQHWEQVKLTIAGETQSLGRESTDPATYQERDGTWDLQPDTQQRLALSAVQICNLTAESTIMVKFLRVYRSAEGAANGDPPAWQGEGTYPSIGPGQCLTLGHVGKGDENYRFTPLCTVTLEPAPAAPITGT